MVCDYLEGPPIPAYARSEIDPGIALLRAGTILFSGTPEDSLTIPMSNSGWVLLYAQEGDFSVSQGARTISLHANQAVLLRGETETIIHPHESAGGGTLVFAQCAGSVADALLLRLPESAFSPFILMRDSHAALSLFILADDVKNGTISNAYVGATRTFSLFTELCRRLGEPSDSTHPELIRHAVSIIELEYEYLYGMDELAQTLEVSKHHLIREFSRCMGISPGKYLTNTRIKHAKELLAGNEYTVEIVGQLVGYANGNYFCKVFRSTTGMSPGQYRANLALQRQP